MGIRYYAYAFDRDQTAAALADPRAFISSDPFADAWGMEPHTTYGVATFQQRTPERDLLYLDKAWRDLQQLTRQLGQKARPSYRMFEGDVSMARDCYSWTPWVRAIPPDEVVPIAEDLVALTDRAARVRLRRRGAAAGDEAYVLQYLASARTFMAGLARDGRGMAYLIG